MYKTPGFDLVSTIFENIQKNVLPIQYIGLQPTVRLANATVGRDASIKREHTVATRGTQRRKQSVKNSLLPTR